MGKKKPKRDYQMHGAYTALRLAQEGKMPRKTTRLGKAMLAVEAKLKAHYDGFNELQDVHFALILQPRILFLLQCPVYSADGSLHIDWHRMSVQVEKSLQILDRFMSPDKSREAPDLEAIIIEAKEESDQGPPRSD